MALCFSDHVDLIWLINELRWYFCSNCACKNVIDYTEICAHIRSTRTHVANQWRKTNHISVPADRMRKLKQSQSQLISFSFTVTMVFEEPLHDRMTEWIGLWASAKNVAINLLIFSAISPLILRIFGIFSNHKVHNLLYIVDCWC